MGGGADKEDFQLFKVFCNWIFFYFVSSTQFNHKNWTNQVKATFVGGVELNNSILIDFLSSESKRNPKQTKEKCKKTTEISSVISVVSYFQLKASISSSFSSSSWKTESMVVRSVT